MILNFALSAQIFGGLPEARGPSCTFTAVSRGRVRSISFDLAATSADFGPS
jgi:hypothetical protein